MSDFKLTYATLFNPPEELHTRYDATLVKVKAGLGADHGMFINGKDVYMSDKFEDRNPADITTCRCTCTSKSTRSSSKIVRSSVSVQCDNHFRGDCHIAAHYQTWNNNQNSPHASARS